MKLMNAFAVQVIVVGAYGQRASQNVLDVLNVLRCFRLLRLLRVARVCVAAFLGFALCCSMCERSIGQRRA